MFKSPIQIFDYDPTSMVAKDTNYGNFQQLMVQNPALQWLRNSVFISLATMLLYGGATFPWPVMYWPRNASVSIDFFVIHCKLRPFPKQVVLVPLVRIINFMESMIPQRLFYHWLLFRPDEAI